MGSLENTGNISAPEFTLYDMEVSGNCYKVRLFLSILGQQYKKVPVDFMGGEHKQKPFLDLNPLGQLPVLKEGNFVLRNSQAILVYLARRFGGDTWLPTEPAAMAAVMEWLMVAENEVAHGLSRARRGLKFGNPEGVPAAQAKAVELLAILERHLSEREWLALDRATIADLACFPYVALAHEGQVSLAPYPAVQAWVERCKSLPSFVGMPGI